MAWGDKWDVYAIMHCMEIVNLSQSPCHGKPESMHRGVLRHIIVLGIEHRKIFRSGFDRVNFIERLGAIVRDTDLVLEMLA